MNRRLVRSEKYDTTLNDGDEIEILQLFLTGEPVVAEQRLHQLESDTDAMFSASAFWITVIVVAAGTEATSPRRIAIAMEKRLDMACSFSRSQNFTAVQRLT